jgi:single-strand DNA-binding protein
MNTTTVAGNLTQDPELTSSGQSRARATLTVAINHGWKDAQGTWHEGEPTFLPVVVWGDLAEHAAGSLAKGDRVVVTGRMTQRSWETDEGRRSRLELTADEIAASLRYATVQISRTRRPQASTDS